MDRKSLPNSLVNLITQLNILARVPGNIIKLKKKLTLNPYFNLINFVGQ